MTDSELLAKVKSGLSVGGKYNDTTLSIKTLAAKQYMLGIGITTEQMESELGIACLTVGVNDLWNMSPGEVQFSRAFEILLIQLQNVSDRDVET